MSEAPFDRSIALAASVQTLHEWCIDVRCTCGQITILPLQLLLRDRPRCATATLADVALRLTCRSCHARPGRVALVETTLGRSPSGGGGHAGWHIALIGP